MSTNDTIPTYNLKVVVRETGLKPDTLRAWERRYDMPQPDRTSGGHRLYSQRDIDILKWLVARQEEGLSISRAVDLWRQLESEGRDPLQEEAEATVLTPLPAISTAEGTAINEIREAWITACLNFDEQSAEYILTQAFALYPQELVCIELIMHGLAQIGQDWYKGDVTVQQEHFASALALRRLESLLAAAPAPTRPERLLIGCSSEEDHTFSPLLLTLLLRRKGWHVIYLGADVPLDRFEKTLESSKSDLVILSAQQLTTAATLLEMAHLLQQEKIPLAYGGRIFNMLPDLRSRIPGYFLGEKLENVPQVVEQILTSSPHLPQIEYISQSYQEALDSYLERRTLIEADVWQELESSDILNSHRALANANMSRYVTAALTLGDLDYLGLDLDWVRGLLTNYKLPVDLMRQYLQVYNQVAAKHLNTRGKPIVDWLTRITEKYESK